MQFSSEVEMGSESHDPKLWTQFLVGMTMRYSPLVRSVAVELWKHPTTHCFGRIVALAVRFSRLRHLIPLAADQFFHDDVSTRRRSVMRVSAGYAEVEM
jgi:hypothetical protein